MNRMFSCSALLALAAASSVHAVTIPVGILTGGELVITEIMQNPAGVADAAGEYFEIYNLTPFTINLNGMVISDLGIDSHTVVGDVFIPAQSYFVFGINGDFVTNGGVDVNYAYSGLVLGNGADELYLFTEAFSGAPVIDFVEWDDGATFPDPTGASMELQGDLEVDNRLGSNWQAATSSWPGSISGDFGSPGLPNSVVPVPPAVWLFGSGLIGLIGIARRKKA